MFFQQQAKQEEHEIPRNRRVEQPIQDDDDALVGGPEESPYEYCERTAAEGSSINFTCSCNQFNDGIVELSCLENCIYCGDTESSSCGQFSYSANLTNGMNSKTTRRNAATVVARPKKLSREYFPNASNLARSLAF